MNGFPPGFSPGGGGPFGSPPAQPTQMAPPPLGHAPPNGQGQGQTPAVQAHYCFSGSLSCSGCNPCDACAQAIKQYVLVPALLEEQAALGQDLPMALSQGRGVDLQLLADTFFRMTAASWRQLHVTMQSMPAHNRPFRVMNVSKVLEAAEVGRQVLVERERAAAAAAQAAQPPIPIGAAASPIPNMPPQNMAVPMPPPQPQAAPSHVVPQIAASKPVDFDRAMRAGGDVSPGIITVQAEESAGSPAASNGAREPRTVSTDDFSRAAGAAPNGADNKATS